MVETGEINIKSDSGRRLFLACWPDQSLQELLYDLARRLQLKHGGRRTERENIHLTLVFLGQVHREKEQQLRQRLRLLDIKQFELELDQAGSFTHCRINWIGPSIVPQGLKELHSVLKRISRELGFHSDQRAYRPHISLLRNCHSEAEHVMKPVQWKVNRFYLIESRQKRGGVEYKIIEEFPPADEKAS
ncbi:MAG TPA: RNA 2',3'-cyclic phosphodiesterase [Gammaproteobacteria bacterium]|nr:2'-5'-RNA ligase [bacterium BMS3Abin11]HDH17152.1 RNA 2',3'-cyclic phosphodiesterase [Gammaproteobacteria bacterium]